MTLRDKVYEAVARSLRDFGYPDVTAKMIGEIHAAMEKGEQQLPHGVIGMFAQNQLVEAKEKGLFN